MVKVRGAKTHNLKNIDLDLPQNALITFTGVSGSGKSSAAFDTIFIEGQRRYVESLSHSARRMMGELIKPDVDLIEEITPTISIEQKTVAKNPRSTVGTITEIYDFLRVLFARLATPHCPESGEVVIAQSKETIINSLKTGDKPIIILASICRKKKGTLKDDIESLVHKGFTRIRIDGTIAPIGDITTLAATTTHDLDVVIDRITPKNSPDRCIESVTLALEMGKGSFFTLNDQGEESFYSTFGYSPTSQRSYPALTPQDFSFNSPEGMCPDCHGLGTKQEYILEKIIDPNKSIEEDCCSIASSYATVRYGNIYNNLAKKYSFSVKTPWKKLSEKAKKVLLSGTEQKWTRMTFIHPETGAIWRDIIQWRGFLNEAYERYKNSTSDGYKKKHEELMRMGTCSSCNGGKLKPYPLAARFFGKTLPELTNMTIEDLHTFFKNVSLKESEKAIGADLIAEILFRTEFLMHVGLEYIALDRGSPTLSGGEAQRVRLASQIGAGLVGITYILDEPSIGLHPQDNSKLIGSLKKLRDKGNTIIVVEHDEETILSSDYVVDFGPRAGSQGGHVIYAGGLPGLLKHPKSITGAFLAGRESIAIPQKRRKKTKQAITLTGATLNNLKNVTLKIPCGLFVAITGVSGSGKSSLFLETLYPALHNRLIDETTPAAHFKELKTADIDKVIEIDQSPIGRTNRSNPSTYIGIFDSIRKFYAQLPQSEALGFTPGRFSFNVREGSCTECGGLGVKKIDMDFVEASSIECPKCRGMRFDEETLSIRYNGKNIRDVLEMDAIEALDHFSTIPHIAKELQTLISVGLDYLKLGQSSTTLSGGEAQRIKLARELVRPATGKTLYIFDEPTTGLHFADIKKLLVILHALVDKGNSVVVIEHNMDVVKTADWIIDMGPSSGIRGGKIIFEGTPEQLVTTETPSGTALKKHINGTFAVKTAAKASLSKEPKREEMHHALTVVGARQNNLKDICLSIPHGSICVVNGPSGSGKSSLCFDTIYSEGQRRYVESLSPYMRQFVEQLPKPKADAIEGLYPTISVERGILSMNPRSTVGTMSEVYDYLRILYARLGIPHCPRTGFSITAISKEFVAEKLSQLPEGEKIIILAPQHAGELLEFKALCRSLLGQGFSKIRLNKTFYALDEEIPFDAKQKNELMLVLDRIVVDNSQKMRLLEALALAARYGNDKVYVAREKEDLFFNLAFAVHETGESFPEITHKTFAFNTPEGMCSECQGLGLISGIDKRIYAHHATVTLLSWMREGWAEYGYSSKLTNYTPQYTARDHEKAFLEGSQEGTSSTIDDVKISVRFRGLTKAVEETNKLLRGEVELPEKIKYFLQERPCPACEGTRLHPLARHVTINDKSLAELVNTPVDEVFSFLKNLKPDFGLDRALKQVYEEICDRLSCLVTLGLGYLTMNRSVPTLSGGEAQRLKLAKEIGSNLSHVLYVIDEPSRGLHHHDIEKVTDALLKLQKLQNTLLVVDHNPLLQNIANHLITLGPASGVLGGKIIYQGVPQKSTTEAKLTLKKPFPGNLKAFLPIKNASCNNLKNISINIPVDRLVTITGVSGSGKSTLLFDVIAPLLRTHFDAVAILDQSPIGSTHRSDIASSLGILDALRNFFSALPESCARGLNPAHFSAYNKRGMCTTCSGLGYKMVPMHFLPPVHMVCTECKGLRLNPMSLQITYEGKNLGQVLQMTIDEAMCHFARVERIVKRLKPLQRVGLSYLTLGQEMQTLSSGELQRVRLAGILGTRSRSFKVSYLFDEPTAGLSPDEVAIIIEVLHDLTKQGHCVMAIEHNLPFIAASDYVIDLGPGAGKDGGHIVATGAPSEIAANPNSITGKFLR